MAAAKGVTAGIEPRGFALPQDAQQRVSPMEQGIDKRVAALYGL